MTPPLHPDLPTGKVPWSSKNITWPGTRFLLTGNRKTDLEYHVASIVDSVERSLFTTQPTWCSFKGVTCGSIPGTSSYASVVSINLFYQRLVGSLPASISNFQSLTSFDVRFNSLSGPIPTAIGDWGVGLKFLGLESNRFSGTIPSNLYALKSLVGLNLGSNSLVGTIPSALGNWASLTTLYLGGNFLTGTIPPSISTLTALRGLYLHSNKLQGAIPQSISALTRLQYIYMNSNSLSGSIPTAMVTLRSLEDITLSTNNLSGTIPSEISKLTKLNNLDLNTNYLTMGAYASLPPSIFATATLNGYLSVSNNCVEFTSPINSEQSTTATRCRVSILPTEGTQYILSNLLLFSVRHLIFFLAYYQTVIISTNQETYSSTELSSLRTNSTAYIQSNITHFSTNIAAYSSYQTAQLCSYSQASAH